MTKILIADNHPIVRRGLIEILADSHDITVDEAGDGHEVLEKIREKKYDVVVLDISMPGINGLEVLKRLKSEKFHPSVLFLSRHPDEQYGVRVIKAGADGYLTKESAPQKLVQAIRKVARGEKYISPSIAQQLAVYVESDSGEKPHEKLSDREFQVMQMIAGGNTVGEIAGEMALSINTISTYRVRILEKMKLKNNAQIMSYALKEKLVD